MEKLSVVYLCRNAKEYHSILVYLHKKGYRWRSGELLISERSEEYIKDNIDAIFVDEEISYGNIEWAKRLQDVYQIIEACSLTQKNHVLNANKLPLI